MKKFRFLVLLICLLFPFVSHAWFEELATEALTAGNAPNAISGAAIFFYSGNSPYVMTPSGVSVPLGGGATAFQFPTKDGTVDQVLVTDGSGKLSWSAQSGGGGGSGATWYQTDDGYAQISGGTLYFRGASGISSSATGATVYFGNDGSLAISSQVSAWGTPIGVLTSHTQTLSGASGEATNAGVQAQIATLSGASGEATNAGVQAQLVGAAFSGQTDFLSQVSNWGISAPNISSQIQTLSGASGEATNAGVQSQLTTAAFSGETDFTTHSQVSGFVNPLLTVHTNAGAVSGVSLVANYQLASIAVSFLSAQSGDSVFVVSPFAWTLSGVSLISEGNATGGVTVWKGAATGIVPDIAVGDQMLIQLSGSGTSVYHASGTTNIEIGRILLFDLGTAGASNWTVQLFGKRD
ncbi:MAG: hypothetical protein KKC77_19200 [Proteobacteria bacterium]|nr:hypothetical protein [Pseudomonadota bacterium]